MAKDIKKAYGDYIDRILLHYAEDLKETNRKAISYGIVRTYIEKDTNARSGKIMESNKTTIDLYDVAGNRVNGHNYRYIFSTENEKLENHKELVKQITNSSLFKDILLKFKTSNYRNI